MHRPLWTDNVQHFDELFMRWFSFCFTFKLLLSVNTKWLVISDLGTGTTTVFNGFILISYE